jgi:hypothetical protein
MNAATTLMLLARSRATLMLAFAPVKERCMP